MRARTNHNLILLPLLLLLALAALPAASAFGSFAFKDFSYSAVNRDGTPATQAGSHPWELTTAFRLNATTNLSEEVIPDGDVKDTEVNTPLGLVGNPTATPKCSIQQFTTPPRNKEELPNGTSYLFSGATCPNDSQLGVAALELTPGGPEFIGVYNLEPPRGVPAEFGFDYAGEPVILTATLRPDGSYGLTVHARDISQTEHVFGIKVTLWGVPADPGHDGFRGECLGTEDVPVEVPGGCPAGVSPRPFLTLPTSCPAGPPVMSIRADAWQNPGVFVGDESGNLDSEGNPLRTSGCGRLDFSPTLSLAPDTRAANAPTGLEADLKLPQNDNPAGLAESHLRTASVTLPPGLVLNPAAAAGRQACTPAQIELNSQSTPLCPDSSKIGTVTATTPLLEAPLEGSVYLAAQEENPFDSLLAIYIVAEDEALGVHVKLAGQVHLDPSTGQIETTFDGNRLYGLGKPAEGEPQLPFSDLRLRFFGGPRAALMTPECGTYAANAAFTPWSGGAAVSGPLNPFQITTGCGGAFAPSLLAGTSNNSAGAFSPFITTIARTDSDQKLSRVSVTIPPGLLGMLSRVTLCPEAQAATGTCSPASQVGHLNATAGAGPDPVSLPEPGRQEDPVYLTGPYGGGAFGLSIVAHPEAGPFNLGAPIIVRAGIHVDPSTAQITVVTDPLPTIVKGIPLDIRSATVTIDRAGTSANQFTFNPTNCSLLAVTGGIASTRGASAAVSGPFQAADCAALPFKPGFKVSTQARTSKANGASLTVKVTSGQGQANIAKVDLQLPKALPARLTTLQKACTEAQFSANPAGCPAGSVIGYAKAITPVLNVPLTGPAYLVSHGGAAFPDVEFILQGQGVRIDLDGKTQIKQGITYSRFETVPDAPISSFETVLPQGPHSVLATNLPLKAKGSLCGTRLVIPTTLTGQNGAVLAQSTKVTVSGCAKVAKIAKVKKKAKSGRSVITASHHRTAKGGG
jgi:hypothetical protein